MGLTMKEKQAVTKQLALEYKRARKKKGKILDTVIELKGVINAMKKDDTVKIGFGNGIVHHEGNTYHFPALPKEVLSILEDGGLIPHVRKSLGE